MGYQENKQRILNEIVEQTNLCEAKRALIDARQSSYMLLKTQLPLDRQDLKVEKQKLRNLKGELTKLTGR